MPKQQSLEAALSELEALTKELEAGNLPLAEAMKKYKSGLAIVEKCRKELDSTRAQLHMLTGVGDEITETEFKVAKENENE